VMSLVYSRAISSTCRQHTAAADAKDAFGRVLQHGELNSSKLHTGSSPRSQSGGFSRDSGPRKRQRQKQRRAAARVRAMERTKTISPMYLHGTGVMCRPWIAK